MTAHFQLKKLREVSNLPRIPQGMNSTARISINLLDFLSFALGRAMLPSLSPFLEHPK